MKKQKFKVGDLVKINGRVVDGMYMNSGYSMNARDSIWTLAVCTKAYAGLSYSCYIVETGETIRITTQSIREAKHYEETTI